MRKVNYKGEAFAVDGSELFQNLEAIAAEVKSNLLSSERSFLVSHIIKEKYFNRVFINFLPNNLEHKHYRNEHNGLYAFATVENGEVDFKYIGISRTIKKRFFDHTKSKKHNNANWAFLMAQHGGEESPLLGIPTKQLEMHGMRFTFIHIENPYLRSMAEVYCANKFKSYWNSFDTH